MSNIKSKNSNEEQKKPKSRHWSTFRRSLKQLLREKGKTQVQLARRLGIRKQAISAWLNESEDPQPRTPNVEYLLEIADFLEVSLDRLMGRSIPEDETLKSIRDFALKVASAVEGKLPIDFDQTEGKSKKKKRKKTRAKK